MLYLQGHDRAGLKVLKNRLKAGKAAVHAMLFHQNHQVRHFSLCRRYQYSHHDQVMVLRYALKDRPLKHHQQRFRS